MARRQSTLKERTTSNDTAKLLDRVERRLRRVGKTRDNRALKNAYKEAADLVHRIIQ